MYFRPQQFRERMRRIGGRERRGVVALGGGVVGGAGAGEGSMLATWMTFGCGDGQGQLVRGWGGRRLPVLVIVIF